MARTHAVLAFFLICLVVSPSRASAHVGHVISRAERYLKLDVSGHDVRMVVSLTLGPSEGQTVLEAADADGDAEVSRAESDAYLAAWGEGLRQELPLSLDGEPLELSWSEGYFAPLGRVRPVPLTVEMVSHFELGGGEQTVRFVDRMVRREVFERTDVAFRVRDGAELVLSGVEGETETATPDLSYPGTFHEGEDVALIATIRTAERPDEESPWMAGLIGLAIVVVGLVVFRVRRR